jgi:lysophospholipase L1-like esterase
MNTKLVVRAFCAPFLLAVAGVCSSAAQTTNAPASSADASQFPSLDKLPGKVPTHVWTGLSGKWAADHARWQTTASNDVGAVVFLGDSITEGWKTLATDFPKMKVANRGIGGDITSGVLYRLKADVLSLNPEAIVLLIGTNDVGDGADGDDVAANIKLILLAIKAYNPNMKVIVCKVMPRAERSGQGQEQVYAPIYAEKIQKANAEIEELVKSEPNFRICETWGIYADDKGSPNPEDFNGDHLHLNAAGYAVWKKTLDPVLADLHLGNGKAE